MIANQLLLMDHVAIMSADTIALVSYFIFETCKYKSIFEVWFMTYMFFLVF